MSYFSGLSFIPNPSIISSSHPLQSPACHTFSLRVPWRRAWLLSAVPNPHLCRVCLTLPLFSKNTLVISLLGQLLFTFFFSDSNSTQAKLYLDLLGKSGPGQQDHGLICVKWNHLTDKHWIPSARHYDRNQRCIRGTRSEPGKQPAVLGLAEKIPQVP